jgi:hypothetical protein
VFQHEQVVDVVLEVREIALHGALVDIDAQLVLNSLGGLIIEGGVDQL